MNLFNKLSFLNTKYSFLILFALLFVFRSITYTSEQYYLIDTNDRFFYLSLAESFSDTGQFIDYTTTDRDGIRGRHIGVPLLFTFYQQLLKTSDAVFLMSSVLGSLLFFLSLFYFLHYLFKKYGFRYLHLSVILLFIFLLQEYYEFILWGLTESYFYSFTLLWLVLASKFLEDKFSVFQLTLLLLLGFCLTLFRIQFILLFAALFFAIVLYQKWNLLPRYAIVTFIPILCFFLLVQNTVVSAEQSATDGIIATLQGNPLPYIKNLLPVFHLHWFNFGAAGPLSNIFYILISIPLWLYPIFCFIRYRETFFANKLLVLASLIIIISLFAFFASAWWRINLRYIYYILPLMVFTIIASTRIDSSIIRYYIFGCMAIVILFNLRIFTSYNITKNYQGYTERIELVQSYHTLKDLNTTYQPTHAYNVGPTRSPRFIYATTGKSVIPDITSEFKPNSFIFLSEGQLSQVNREDFEYLYNYNYGGSTYHLFYNPPME